MLRMTKYVFRFVDVSRSNRLRYAHSRAAESVTTLGRNVDYRHAEHDLLGYWAGLRELVLRILGETGDGRESIGYLGNFNDC